MSGVQDELHIQKATPKDAFALYELRYRAYIETYSLYSDPASPCLEPFEVFRDRLETGFVFCLYASGKLIGGVSANLMPSFVEVAELYIDPAYQGRGIGEKALGLLEIELPSAVYTASLQRAEPRGLFFKAGYRCRREAGAAGSRCVRYLWEKQAYQKLEILLGPLKREQLPAIAEWMQALDAKARYECSDGRVTEAVPTLAQVCACFEAGRHIPGAKQLDFVIDVPAYNAAIGVISLTQLDWDVHRGQISNLLIAPRWRGVGLGRLAVESVCQTAFERYGFRGLRVNLFADNPAARRCFEGAGFSVALVQEKDYAVSESEYVDRLVLMRRAEAEGARDEAAPPEI